MSYTRSALESDVESLVNEMARKLESDAECDGDGDVSISGKDRTAREYARKIADLVGDRIGLR